MFLFIYFCLSVCVSDLPVSDFNISKKWWDCFFLFENLVVIKPYYYAKKKRNHANEVWAQKWFIRTAKLFYLALMKQWKTFFQGLKHYLMMLQRLMRIFVSFENSPNLGMEVSNCNKPTSSLDTASYLDYSFLAFLWFSPSLRAPFCLIQSALSFCVPHAVLCSTRLCPCFLILVFFDTQPIYPYFLLLSVVSPVISPCVFLFELLRVFSRFLRFFKILRDFRYFSFIFKF